MIYRLGDLSKKLGCKLVGDSSVLIKGISDIQNAKEGDLTFLSNPKYSRFLKTTEASAIILSRQVQNLKAAQLICDEPYVAFAKALSLFYIEKLPYPSISPSSRISKSARIGRNVYIGENAFIGENVSIGDNVRVFPNVYIGDDSVIGSDTTIFPNVTIYPRTVIGRSVRVHSGTVIGSDGFGYAFSKKENRIYKIPQAGNVVIGDYVEIGANTTIDRATVGSTVIGNHTKIDNLVQIGHNVRIGCCCFIVSQVGISGSAVIGDHVTLAGKVGVAGHIRVSDNITVAAKSGITKDLNEKGIYAGFPAVPYGKWRRRLAIFNMLPEIYEKIKTLLGGKNGL
jgi:UDP-3-O-[3-hydroxymyristoyl] glucosamine N-acyltransferase